MATYKAEVLHQRYRRRLRPAAHYALGWLPRWARAGRRARRGWPTRPLRRPPLAALAKRLGGIDAPPAAAALRRRRPSARGSPTRPAAATGAPVLLWVDTFTDHFSPEVGQAAVRVLEDAGYAVRITDEAGVLRADLDLDRPARRRPAAAARARSTRSIRRCRARHADRRARAVVHRGAASATSPSCCPTTRARRRSPAATDTLAELLAAPPGWTPPTLDGVAAVAQPHCHQHAVMGCDADADLLAGAGADVDAVGGCCGLAGNFGVERGHYDVSVAVAETALLPPSVRPSGRAAPRVSCSPTGSPAAPSSSSWPVRGLHLAQLLDAHAHRSSPVGRS